MKFGIFCSVDGKNTFLDESSDLVKFKLNKVNEIYSLEFENVSDKSINVYSAMLEIFLTGNKVLEHGWLQCSDVFFRDAHEHTRKNKIFLLRDQNPFSFDEDYGYLKNSIVSEWFTIIRGETCSLIGAVTTKDQFTQIFVRKEDEKLKVRITFQFDGINLAKNKKIRTEKLAMLTGEEEEIKIQFNELIRKHMHIKKKPRPVTGVCCAYYWNCKSVSEAICLEELDSLHRKGMRIDYFQIDDGYVKVGDWLDYKKKFPSGFKSFIKKAKEYGFKPGIWISPFIAEHDSKLFKLHPEWFLKINDRYLRLETSPFEFLPGLNFKVLDPTNKEVRSYLKEVFLHFKELGFELFKIDFLSSVCLVKYENITRAKVLSESIEFVRKILGEKIHILSGITQISPLVGIIDSARLGIDTLLPQLPNLPIVNEIGNYMLKRNLRSCEHRKHFDLWATDPDCIVLNHGIKKELISNQISFIKKNNACLWIGDRIHSLSDNQAELLKSIRP